MSIFDLGAASKPANAFAVLDTNVVLAATYFADPAVQPLWDAVRQGRLHWLATPAMVAELTCVARRMTSPRGSSAWLETALALARSVPSDAPGLATRLWCTDPNDQIFIDLALTQGAAWLFSRDKALLRLSRRARLRGVQITRPDGWRFAPGA